jgi:MYXO-CTERM domain-containing protein
MTTTKRLRGLLALVGVLALQLEDHGGATAFMAMITSDDAATNPTFIVRGPPALAALALVGLFTRRRSA